jgi:transposase-like protein
MRQGFLYLVAIIDWATRRVLSWRLSNTLTAGFCVEALGEALARFGKPGIFNTIRVPSSPATSSPRWTRDVGAKRKQHSAEFKARVAMAFLSGEKTLAELSADFGVHPTMISSGRQDLVKRAGELFARGSKAPAVRCAEGDRRSAPQDRAAAGRARFSCRAARRLPSAERRAMIAPEAGLSVSRQRALSGLRAAAFIPVSARTQMVGRSRESRKGCCRAVAVAIS